MGNQPTATALPTSPVDGLQVVTGQACLVAEQGIIRVEEPQGDLVAWSPVADTLAYIASTHGSTWNVGELTVISAPAFDAPVRLASQAAGELSWSPGGITIAYLSLRRSDNLYTIGLVNPDGRNLRDLFPDEAARTDSFSSQKAIQGWVDDVRLQVLASCGVDCMQRLDFGILTGLSTPSGDPIQRASDLWSVHKYQPAMFPEVLDKLGSQLNWSVDLSRAAYIDDNGNTWVIDPQTNTLLMLDTGAYGSATESDWSYDGKYLAVRVDETLKIFSFECP
ncbi:MAG: hypothetical protein A2136_06670 [Chloroflexi bacterium RBG_16_54_11]|nr:MAG: hypothetical protein A2136_06670 [Chloroflexi bacterium RBG_16_54_11]